MTLLEEALSQLEGINTVVGLESWKEHYVGECGVVEREFRRVPPPPWGEARFDELLKTKYVLWIKYHEKTDEFAEELKIIK